MITAFAKRKLVADGEALLVVSRLLQLVNHGYGIVLYGDMARACGRVHDEVVLAQAELTRTLAFVSIFESTGRREEHPVEVVLLGEVVEIEVAQ